MALSLATPPSLPSFPLKTPPASPKTSPSIPPTTPSSVSSSPNHQHLHSSPSSSTSMAAASSSSPPPPPSSTSPAPTSPQKSQPSSSPSNTAWPRNTAFPPPTTTPSPPSSSSATTPTHGSPPTPTSPAAFFRGVERTESEVRMEEDKIVPLAAADLLWELALTRGADRDHEYCNPMKMKGVDWKRVGWRCLVRGYNPLVDRQRMVAEMMEREGVKVVAKVEEEGYHAAELFGAEKAEEMVVDVPSFVYGGIGGPRL